MRRFFFLHVLGLALAGCVWPARAADAPPIDTAAARKLYVNKCAKCHKFYDPARYSDREWEEWMKKMGKKSKLKPAQQQLLSRYIDETYRGGKDPKSSKR